VLTGGIGADTFVFAAATDSRGANWDSITDFTQGTDKINLSALDADLLLAGDQSFSFIGSAGFGHHAGELRVSSSTPGVLRVLADVDGNGTADFELRLDLGAGITGPLTASDFLL
jgi:Ca2+-binding RTX toxin-like protein